MQMSDTNTVGQLLVRARNLLSHPAHWHGEHRNHAKCMSLSAEIATYIAQPDAAPTPVAPQPLTDEKIDALSDETFDLIQGVPDELVGDRTWDRMFARAIELAHGISQEGGAS
jgi:hypothetical protein